MVNTPGEGEDSRRRKGSEGIEVGDNFVKKEVAELTEVVARKVQNKSRCPRAPRRLPCGSAGWLSDHMLGHRVDGRVRGVSSSPPFLFDYILPLM